MKFLIAALLLNSSFAHAATSHILKIEGTNIISQQSENIDFSKSEKGTVLVFLSPLCPCSNAHTETLKNLIKEFKDFKFIGVYSSDDTDEFPEYFKTIDLGIPVIKDNKYSYANQLGALATPHAFVINAKGDVIYKGGVTSTSKAKPDSEQLLKNALNQILQKKEVKPSETRVLGCPIRDT